MSMLGFNKVIIIGILGHNPEIRYTSSGMAITTLNVAIYEKKDNNNSWGYTTDWFNVVCLGKSAENIGKFLKKGRQIFVDGKLQNRLWKNKDGQKSLITEIIAKQVIFLGKQELSDADNKNTLSLSNDIPF